MGKVEPFPQPKNLPETLEELVEKTHELAKDSGNVYWDNPHVQLRMKERSVTIPYHYSECGLDNVYLVNGVKFTKTSRGTAVSINDIDGLHKAIGIHLVTSKKNLSGQEICFLRHEMLMSQRTLANLLGVSDQAVHRWEKEKTVIPKPSELLLRLLYREHVRDEAGKISKSLKSIADLEDELNAKPIHFKDTSKGWQTAA